MRLLDFVIIKLTLCFIVGILIGYFITIPIQTILYICCGLLMWLMIALVVSRNKLEKTIWFGTTTFLTMTSIGILVVDLHDQRQFQDDYSNVISIENDSIHTVIFKVREVLKPTAYHDKYVVDLIKVENESVSGKLLLNLQKDSIQEQLQVDDILISKTSLLKINTPLNPYQFNYSDYLKKQYIDHQIFVEHNTLLKVRSKANSVFGYASRIRDHIDKKLKTYNFKPDELAIIDALLLGQRKDISQDTYNNYVNAGAIHILAVSGLHIGIILILLQWMFRHIERLKHGNYIKMFIIAILLWCFAIIAGLSPSVTRAVSMFTVVAIGLNLKRPANIYNTLAISMFFLLLFKPRFLFEVGFQMSYLAVISIVSIQPLLEKLWQAPNKVAGYFWDIFTVTIAAQIGVVPISLYYFHQFPGLFFISNLIVIPLLTLNLCFGIFIIITAVLKILPQFVADIYGFCVSSMNNFVSWVSHQESFVLRNISFGPIFLIVSYILIISLILYFKKPKYSRLVFALIAVLLMQSAFTFKNYKSHSNEFVVFHKSKFSLIGFKNNQRLTVTTNLDSLTQLKDNVIKNYMVGNYIAKIESSEMQSVYEFNNEKLLVIDSLGVFQVTSFKPDFVLLRNSPKINLIRMIDSLKPKLVIADGSNYKSYVERWKATCEKQKIPFHQTSEKGAFIYKY